MGYWQNGIEIDKKGMLPYGNAGLTRVNGPYTQFMQIRPVKQIRRLVLPKVEPAIT